MAEARKKSNWGHKTAFSMTPIIIKINMLLLSIFFIFLPSHKSIYKIYIFTYRILFTLFDSKSSSERQTRYKNEWGSLANVDLVVAKMVPPTFNLTQEANEANGGFWLEFDSTASILAISNRTSNTKGLVNQSERTTENIQWT